MYKLEFFPLTIHAGRPSPCALGTNGRGTTICFLEQAYSDFFSISQQDINTNVLKFAEMAVRYISYLAWSF